MKDEDWEKSLAINLTSAFRYVRECIPSMKERRWGRIINVSSQVVYTGSNNHAHYSAAKSGLLGFTFSLTKELGPFGITANVVAPGRIVTDLLLERMAGREQEWMSQTPMRRLGSRGSGRRHRLPGLGRRQLHHRRGHQRERRIGHGVENSVIVSLGH